MPNKASLLVFFFPLPVPVHAALCQCVHMRVCMYSEGGHVQETELGKKLGCPNEIPLLTSRRCITATSAEQTCPGQAI